MLAVIYAEELVLFSYDDREWISGSVLKNGGTCDSFRNSMDRDSRMFTWSQIDSLKT
jgi:hypothetical protein